MIAEREFSCGAAMTVRSYDNRNRANNATAEGVNIHIEDNDSDSIRSSSDCPHCGHGMISVDVESVDITIRRDNVAGVIDVLQQYLKETRG